MKSVFMASFLTCVACHGVTRVEIVNAKTPVPMAVVVPIPKETPVQCDYIDYPPAAPEEVERHVDDDDIIRRVYVHIGQYNESVKFEHDVSDLLGQMRACLAKLQGEP